MQQQATNWSAIDAWPGSMNAPFSQHSVSAPRQRAQQLAIRSDVRKPECETVD